MVQMLGVTTEWLLTGDDPPQTGGLPVGEEAKTYDLETLRVAPGDQSPWREGGEGLRCGRGGHDQASLRVDPRPWPSPGHRCARQTCRVPRGQPAPFRSPASLDSPWRATSGSARTPDPGAPGASMPFDPAGQRPKAVPTGDRGRRRKGMCRSSTRPRRSRVRSCRVVQPSIDRTLVSPSSMKHRCEPVATRAHTHASLPRRQRQTCDHSYIAHTSSWSEGSPPGFVVHTSPRRWPALLPL